MLKQSRIASLAVTLLATAPPVVATPAVDRQEVGALEDAVWSAANRTALEHALAARDRHGLDRFTLPALDGSEESYTTTALAYAAALAQGAVNPAAFHSVYTLPRPAPVELSDELTNALREDRLASWLDGLPPRDDAYRALSEAYVAASRKSVAGSAPKLTLIAPLRAGDHSRIVPALAVQLRAEGYFVPLTEGTRYTDELAAAVAELQRGYGIAADGIVGSDTLAVLNLQPGDRARALAVALERRRWLSRTPPATRIDVNVAAATLRYYRAGVLVDERRVIVGAPATETPALRSPIYRLVANPTWTVPKSIQHGELAGVGRDYLLARDMELRNGWIVQNSGPQNALGLVKFDMHNEHAIYLHDTATPLLFERSQRHLSHGCVRVEDALGFATLLAEDEGVGEAWQHARESREQSFVALPRQIPVRMLYHNVFAKVAGRIAYRADPYGWNAPIAKALGFADSTAAKARPNAIDVGP